MGEIPFAYERVAPTTWAYLSSLLMLALFFKFNRFWSVRNFDLLLIVLLVPGLLMVEGGRQWMDRQMPPEVQMFSVVRRWHPPKNATGFGSFVRVAGKPSGSTTNNRRESSI